MYIDVLTLALPKQMFPLCYFPDEAQKPIGFSWLLFQMDIRHVYIQTCILYVPLYHIQNLHK